MEYHEAANIFPLDEESLDSLAEDIRNSGQQVAIETMEGKILDGRRRWLACERAGVEPQFREVKPADPIGYVVSLNLHRRQLTIGQKAMCAAKVKDLYEKQAKERQKRKPSGFVPANSPEQKKGDARDNAGKAFGIGGKSVDNATKVLKQAVPEVVQAVEEGRMNVSAGAKLSTQPEEEQRREASQSEKGRSSKPSAKPPAEEPEKPKREEEGGQPKEIKGVGLIKANDAINILTRIPKNDPWRKRGFQLVMDWLRSHS